MLIILLWVSFLFLLLQDPDNFDAQEEEDYLEARLRFHPGHFACDVVWHINLYVHSRLPSRPRGGMSMISTGMASLLV